MLNCFLIHFCKTWFRFVRVNDISAALMVQDLPLKYTRGMSDEPFVVDYRAVLQCDGQFDLSSLLM